MDSKVIDFLKEADKECAELINKTDGDIRDFISEYQKRFDNSVDDSIYATFGEYLCNALGKKINSQTKNKMLQAYLDTNKDNLVVDISKDKDMSKTRPMNDEEIRAYLKDRARRDNYYSYGNKKEYKISHATVGKNFGMGYVTPAGSVYSISIPTNYIFFYLTQEHVDIISNKQKRACAQDFLQFRDSFMTIRDKLLKDNVVKEDINVPVEIARLNKVSATNAVSTGYDSKKRRYLIHEKNVKGKVNTVEFLMKNVGISGGKDTIASLINTTSHRMRRHFKSHNDGKHSIVINAFKRNAQNELTYYGSIQMQEKESYTPLDIEHIKSGNKTCWFAKDMSSSYYARDWSPEAAASKALGTSLGFMLDWKDVLSTPAVREKLEKRIKFFEGASKTLHHLKKKHAALVFIHGVF